MRATIAILGLLMLVLALGACGSEGSQARDLSVLETPIINGEPDTSAEHQAVVALVYRSGGMMGLCTGTLITPTVVLTAGHCIHGDPSSFTVVFGDNYRYPDHERDVSEILAHSSFNINNPGSGYDIALVRMSQVAPTGIQPLAFLPDFMELTSADIGTELIFSGFGNTEDGTNDGLKRWALGYLGYVCNDADGCGGGTPYALYYDQHPGGPCSGDSGGPAFVTIDGREYVVGITSYGDETCLEFGCSTKVDHFTSFITDFTGGGLGEGCNADSQCVVGPCVDGVCCESACDQECRVCNLPGEEGRCRTAPSGTLCSDGDLCNGDETCLMGSCGGGSSGSLDCDDDDPCTDDACNADRGCIHEPMPEGFACGENQACNQGVCVEVGTAGGCASAGGPGLGLWGWMMLLCLPGFVFWLRRRW